MQLSSLNTSRCLAISNTNNL
ncbi:unnamed protein product [Ectocarpus sp. CCAP 1310/34]|nr:unnamed protein product [Ectocarpus sp. CCAP 1310/34]